MLINRIGLLKRTRMSLPELEVYYRQQRERDFKRNKPFRGIHWRKLLHPVLIAGLKGKHLLCRQKIKIIGDKRQRTECPVIYAATHIGWDDIEVAFTAIKKHTYLLFGDPRNFYRNLDGFLLSLNGVIYFDMNIKNDRYIAKETCVRWLLSGGDLLLFPEGAWNITENQVVMKLFPGAVEMAIRGKADIVPIAMEAYGDTWYVNIGRNIDWCDIPIEQKQEKSDELRDILCTLKWEIWEQAGISKRADIPENYSETFLKTFVNESTSDYTVEDIERTRYHVK